MCKSSAELKTRLNWSMPAGFPLTKHHRPCHFYMTKLEVTLNSWRTRWHRSCDIVTYVWVIFWSLLFVILFGVFIDIQVDTTHSVCGSHTSFEILPATSWCWATEIVLLVQSDTFAFVLKRDITSYVTKFEGAWLWVLWRYNFSLVFIAAHAILSRNNEFLLKDHYQWITKWIENRCGEWVTECLSRYRLGKFDAFKPISSFVSIHDECVECRVGFFTSSLIFVNFCSGIQYM